MIVVADTTPLNYLVLIGQAHVLPVLFHRVIAPPAVVGEMLHPAAPALVREWASAPPPWLQVIAPKKVNESLKLGDGETQAIGLACELRADALLLDERKALAVAKRLGLVVTGTLGVVELAAERGLLSLQDAVTALRSTTYRCPAEVFDELLRRDQSRRGKGPASAEPESQS